MIGFELQKMYIDTSENRKVNRDKIKKVQIESKYDEKIVKTVETGTESSFSGAFRTGTR